MQALSRLKAGIAPPYSLRTAIMTGATVVVLALGAVFAALAYSRLEAVTWANAKNWSESMAHLVASGNASALILNDVAAIESNLQQVAELPGIDRVAVYRADGRQLVVAFKQGEAIRSEVGAKARMVVPLDGAQQLPGALQANYYEAWAPVLIREASPSAWVQVHFSLSQRNIELRQLWMASGLGIALLLVLVIASLHYITARALQPIRALSQYAKEMPTHFGSQIEVSHNSIEVGQLGTALNEASKGIAEHIGRTQAIVNTASEAIIGLDAQGKIATLNPAVSSFFGRPEETMLNQPIENCVPGLSVQALEEMFDQSSAYRAGVNRVVLKEFFGTRADGTLFPVEISLGAVAGIEGLRYVCIMRDVTDERAALEFTELYERALACSHNSVFITNAKLKHQPIVYVNDAFQAMLQLPLHQILGKNMEELVSMDSDTQALSELRLAMSEQRIANVTLHKTLPNGSVRTVELSLSPVRSDKGAITNFVGIVLDVTARVMAEEAIAKRRAQLDAIFSLSPDGFVLFDANDHMVFANPAFERMTGWSWSEGAPPVHMDEFESMMGALCDGDQASVSFHTNTSDDQPWQARLHLTRPQTRVVQAQSRRNIAGRSETILYFRDVTHEDAVDRMKSEFLAAAAHELRTPMVSIFGFTELLLKRKFTPERQADMLQTIHRQSGLLVKMINELLDLARIESRGGLDMQIDAHPLTELVENSVKGLMRTDTERQVLVGDTPEVQVLIDPEKMQLAMSNLLSNAFKYSPHGGTVSLNSRIATSEDSGFVVIEVSDQGIGMSPDQLDRAFERFYRADASGNIPGTGLGLSLVKEVAELHQGRVTLTSTLGVGTTAHLWIPLATNQSLAMHKE